MKNKVLIKLIVPEIDRTYNLFIPINKRVGNIINLLNKSINDLTNGLYIGSNKTAIYDGATGIRYEFDDLIRNTNIRNGSVIILI